MNNDINYDLCYLEGDFIPYLEKKQLKNTALRGLDQ